MGYYTRFSLEVLEGDDCITDYQEAIGKYTNGYDDPFNADECKWYDWEKHCRKFSKDNPDILFMVEGEGEDNEDIWRAYFKGGKMQKCPAKIVFDEFNEKLLE